MNQEQKNAIEYNQGPLLIIAGAGTGKTRVIVEKIRYLIGNHLAKPEEILAVTFTEKAAGEMQERVDQALPYGYFQMWISTFHSFADQILKNEATSIGLTPGFRLLTEAEAIIFLKKNLFLFNLQYFRPLGNPQRFLEALFTHFSRLKEEDISPTQYKKWAQTQNSKLKTQNEEEKIESEKYLELANAYKIYQDLKIKEGLLDFADLVYYLIQLFRQRPNILAKYQQQFKYVLVDEFQDTNIAQYQLIKLLCPAKVNPKLTVVGDDSQCLPAGTSITTDNGKKPIEQITIGSKVLTAVGKGYTAYSTVTKVFKRKAKVRLLTFVLENGKKITVTDNHKMFCFLSSASLDKNYYYVYLMRQKKLGWRLGVTNDLPTRLRLEHHADKILGIGSYKTEKEARFYESLYSVKYGIPTLPFSSRPDQTITESGPRHLFKEIDTESAAKKIANDLHLELNSPHFLINEVTRSTSEPIKVNLQMCYRNYPGKDDKDGFLRNPTVNHAVWLETSSSSIIKKLRQAGIKLTKAKKGYRFRYLTANLNNAWHIAEKLVKITGGILDKKFAVGSTYLQHQSARIMPASHILPGNYLPVCEGKKIVYKRVVKREEEVKEEEVYDLEIDKTHNFIANDVVVHNSIYKFRGASISNILTFMRDYPQAKQITLRQNYRSNQTILDASYRLIKHNDPDTLEAKLGISKNLIAQKKDAKNAIKLYLAETVEEEADFVTKQILKLKTSYKFSDFAILSRANNHLEPFIRALARNGIPYQFLGPGMLFKQGEVKDLIAYLKVLYNPEDSVSLFRVLSMEIFNIDSKDLTLLLSMSRKTNLSFFQTIEIYLSFFYQELYQDEFEIYKKYLPFLKKETRENLHKIYLMIKRHLALVKKETAGQILYYFLEDTKYLSKLVSYKTEKEEKIALNISKFFNKLKAFESEHEDASVAAVVEYIEMSMELGESPIVAQTDIGAHNAVNLLTVHSAKGLEFPVVFLVNLTRGRFPTYERRETIPIPEALIKEILPVGDYHQEEERRLFYVGLTRAKDMVFLTLSRFYGEGKREQKISPFVIEALGESFVKKHLMIKEEEKKQLTIFDFKKTEEKSPQQKPLIINFSYTQLETYKLCPLQYKYQFILKIPTAPSAAASFGDTIHKTLQEFYREFIKNKLIGKKRLVEIYKKQWVPLGYSSAAHEARMKVEGEKMLINFFNNFHHQTIKIIDLEKPFKIKIESDIFITGKIDRVDEMTNNQIEIVDYKTGKLPDEKELRKNLQLSIYALAATSPFLYKKKLNQVNLTFYYLPELKKISLKRTSEEMKEVKEQIKKTVSQIRKNDFSPNVGPWCDFCPFRMICEAWQ